MNTSEVLNRAADLIEERGWVSPRDGAASEEIWGQRSDGPLCLEGGIAAATGLPLVNLSHEAASEACPAYAAVWNYLQTDPRWGSRQWALSTGRARPYDWNDELDRTAAEVIEVLRACAVIEASREREAVSA